MFLFNPRKYKAIIIGGSAGSFTIVTKILGSLSKDFPLPIIMCLHRLKDKREGFKEALEIKSKLPVLEPDDKTPIKPGFVYLAPANYHLLVEVNRTLVLNTTDLVQYSRPSIDVLFESAADVYKEELIAIVLSGANKDGGYGSKKVKDRDGLLVVQDPEECVMTTMPLAAISYAEPDYKLYSDKIIEFLQSFYS